MAGPLLGSKIFLVGFMGVGKTTLGRMLAARIGSSFVDMDDVIEDQEGASITEIFDRRGETYFREAERKTLAQLASGPDRAVIACGGGAFASAENRVVMDREGITIWLDQPFERIWGRRVELAAQRPLMRSESEVRRLYAERRFFYREAALEVTVGEDQWEKALEDVIGLLRQRGYEV